MDITVSLSDMTTVNVNITGTVESGFNWGFLSTQPGNIRLFQGPQGTCEEHPWDAMILRDCTTNSDNFVSASIISFLIVGKIFSARGFSK